MIDGLKHLSHPVKRMYQNLSVRIKSTRAVINDTRCTSSSDWWTVVFIRLLISRYFVIQSLWRELSRQLRNWVMKSFYFLENKLASYDLWTLIMGAE